MVAAVERRPLQPGVQSVLCACQGLLPGTRLLRECRRLREDLLRAGHACSRFVLRSEGPVRLQALRRLRDLRPGEGLLCSGAGLLCEARLLREAGLLCSGSRLLCEARLLREAGLLCQARLLREGLRLRAALLPHHQALLRPGLLRQARLLREGLRLRGWLRLREEVLLPSSVGRPGQRHLHREVPDPHRVQLLRC